MEQKRFSSGIVNCATFTKNRSITEAFHLCHLFADCPSKVADMDNDRVVHQEHFPKIQTLVRQHTKSRITDDYTALVLAIFSNPLQQPDMKRSQAIGPVHQLLVAIWASLVFFVSFAPRHGCSTFPSELLGRSASATGENSLRAGSGCLS